MNTEKLFSELDFKDLKLSNRIVMAPMTRSRAINNIPNDLMALYYEQRATAGLLITEATSPSPNGLGYARIPGIYNLEQIEGWKKTTAAVHKKGGKIFIQLFHVGRIAHKDNLPAEGIIFAPSPISADADMWTDKNGMQKTEMPQELSSEDIQNVIEEFVQASKNAIEAGFDGVEIHSANGYLLEQFLNPNSNVRTDNYGGNIENRSRLIIEITKAVAETIGANKVGVRLSPYSTFNTMPVYDEIFKTYDYLSEEISKLNVAYLHLIDYAARASEEGLNLIQKVRSNFKNLLILNGGYTKERAKIGLETDKADLISFGSTFISNPHLPYKLEHNIELTPADPTTFYMPDEKGYTDYV